MFELDVYILKTFCDGKHQCCVVRVCESNSVLKCVLSHERDDLRGLCEVGLTVRLCIMSVDFTRSEPLILVRVASSSEKTIEALAPHRPPQTSSSLDGVCASGQRKRMFFDLLQCYL
jgi:hypothetical protein